MSTPRFARGSKSRLFLYIGAITVAGVVVYFFHRAQVELYDYQRKSEKCIQQQESLSAQFQVIIEYKVRLEKSLQQEKSEHRQLREELQGKLDEEKQIREKENLENINKFTSLQQQYKILQSHHEDLSEECGRLRVTQLQGLDARSKLESALEAAKLEVQNVQRAKEKEMSNLKNQYLQMEVENEKLQKQNKELTENGKEYNSNLNHLQKEVFQLNQALLGLQGELSRCEAHSSNPVQMVGPARMAVGMGVGSAPKASSVPKPSSSPVAVAPDLRAHVSSQKSTTPQINPDAVLSREKAVNAVPMAAAPPVGKEPTPSGAAGSSRKEVAPAGAGPAPPVAAAGDGGGAGDGAGAGAGGGGGGGGNDDDGGAGRAAERPWGRATVGRRERRRAAAAAARAGGLKPQLGAQRDPQPAAFDCAGGPWRLRARARSGPGQGGRGRGPARSAGRAWAWAAPPAPGAAAAAHPGPPHPPLHMAHVPAGVVPAPRGYGLDRDPREEGAVHVSNQDAPDPWHWRRSKAWAAPAIGAMGEAPHRRQLAEPRHVAAHGIPGNVLGAEGVDEAEEREKEIPRQLHNQYGEYNGDNGEYEKERHGDLQLEEGEEEEDDDVDQIDYANDNANGADARQKRLNLKESVPNVKKHDSVMVNPK
ncbi:Uncharacterized protein GBIM_09544 [Gryllus bimaculatus]|nr:Uncharacterized protein GBIM_09544 [Gryllus bimaculatus]